MTRGLGVLVPRALAPISFALPPLRRYSRPRPAGGVCPPHAGASRPVKVQARNQTPRPAQTSPTATRVRARARRSNPIRATKASATMGSCVPRSPRARFCSGQRPSVSRSEVTLVLGPGDARVSRAVDHMLELVPGESGGSGSSARRPIPDLACLSRAGRHRRGGEQAMLCRVFDASSVMSLAVAGGRGCDRCRVSSTTGGGSPPRQEKPR